jgi:cob(I)alamin adenosyltransferase
LENRRSTAVAANGGLCLFHQHHDGKVSQAARRAAGHAVGCSTIEARRVRVYTRTGDKGTTSLYNGSRAPKTDPLFDALGDVDELNAQIGLAREFCGQVSAEPGLEDVGAVLEQIQSRLLDVGTSIATPPKDGLASGRAAHASFSEEHAGWLERWIDTMDEELPPLRNFILPSGGPASAQLHVARTVCRRAERRVVALHSEGVAEASVAVFLNRLSDALFVAARLASKRAGRPETTYQKARTDIPN